MSAYEHGARAFIRGKHIQANPYDFGTEAWREWRTGYLYSNQPSWASYDYNSSR
jgi:hypothetical protein